MNKYPLKPILCLLLSFFISAAQAQGHQWGNTIFRQYTPSDGLISSQVTSILQDKTGIVWLGTNAGLVRFDAYTFTHFKSNMGNKGLSHSKVEELLEDSRGNIWIGTRGGLNLMDPRTEEFHHFTMNQDNEKSISNNGIFAIYEDDTGEIWVGTGNGLNKFNPTTRNFDRYIPPFDGPKKRSFTSIRQGKNGKLWIGGFRAGLLQFDTSTKTFEKINLDVYKKEPKTKHINDLWLDKQNHLWLATDAGLVEFDIDSKQSYLHLMSDNQLMAFRVYKDISNQLWVGYIADGLCRFSPNSKKWSCFSQDTLNFPANGIHTIYQSREGILWIGTLSEGLFHIELNNPFRLMRFEKPYHEIYDVEKDHLGRLWIATAGGVLRVNQNNKVTEYPNENNVNNLSTGSAFNIFASKDKQIWISTQYGLNRYDPVTDRIIPVNIQIPNNKGSKAFPINFISESESSELLLSTYQYGLLRWDKKSAYAEKISIDSNINRTLIEYAPASFLDSKGRFWSFGHRHLGYLNPEGNHFTLSHFFEGPNDFFWQMAEDNKDQLWLLGFDGMYLINPDGKPELYFQANALGADRLSDMIASGDYLWINSINGLFQFNPDTHKVVQHFTVEDGLQSNHFEVGSYLDEDGTIFMGGSNGITVFHPNDIENTSKKPLQVILTDFSINNEYVHASSTIEEPPLPARLAHLDHMKLDFTQSRFFSLEFSALDYYTPQKNRYAYKLDGFNENWIYTDSSNRRATFTNLSPGDYTFHVKASNMENHWPDAGTSLKITILPPWWLTVWAYFLYSVLFITSIFWFIHYRTMQARQRAAKLETEVKLRTNKIQEQKKTIETLLEKKNTLFANVSHEFRTPLTLILGPIKSLLSQQQEKDTHDKLNIVNRSAHRLQGLVEQLLLFSKLSSFESAQAAPCSVKKVIETTAASLRSLMDDHQLHLSINLPENIWVKLTPKDALHTMVSNLLSNAVKYLPAGSQVTVSVHTDDDSNVHIQVQDNGLGVPIEWQDKIFERFSRITKHIKAGIPGTGLGLALVKELVEINSGRITASNAKGGGAVFEITLPSYTPTDHEINEYSSYKADHGIRDTHTPKATKLVAQPHDADKPSVQIIDDTDDMRTYLFEELMDEFNVFMSEDGEAGLESIKHHNPDIIICDIMMPGIDGLEVLKRLRADIEISHTPLILLTAKDDKEYRIKGYEEQADDYITKPFAADELKARLHNILNIRRLLSKKTQTALADTSISENQLLQHYKASEKKFLEKLKIILDQYHQDPDLKVETISEKMHMSQSALNRKVKALLGMPPYQYLRIYRLEKVALLLKAGYEGNLSSLANASGFASSQHFSYSFKEHFGVSPKDFASQNSA